MKLFLRAWDRVWFSRFDPFSAGVFRIFLGALLVAFYLALFPNWERFFAPDGIPSTHTPDSMRPLHLWWWNVFSWTEGVLPVGAFWWVGLVAAACFTLGYWTRLSTVVLFALETSMNDTNRYVSNGEDYVFRMLLFYSCFAPLGHCLSVDGWLRARRASRPVGDGATGPRIWPVRLMQINIALVYALSLPHKFMDDSAWGDGTAMYWTLLSANWSRWPWPKALYSGLVSEVVIVIMTFGTALAEGAFPLLVWFRRTRLYAVAALAGLHLGIAVMLQNVTFFSLAMFCSFWLFVPGETARRWGWTLRRWFEHLAPGRPRVGAEAVASSKVAEAATDLQAQ
jgi:hypothetical protein